jgi:hypothetical protein
MSGLAVDGKPKDFVRIDCAELLLRMVEKTIEVDRPPGWTAKETVDSLREAVYRSGDAVVITLLDNHLQMAQIAVSYFNECVLGSPLFAEEKVH